MKTTEKKLTALIWRRATHLLAAFFVLFAFADVSVLQAYSGNETIGIPSYARQLQIEKLKSKKTDAPVAAQAATDFSGSPGEELPPDPHSSEENCFGCCSHVLLGFNVAESIAREILPARLTASNFSDYRRPHSDSHLQKFYQPPKSA